METSIFILILAASLLAADQSLTDMFSYQLETCNYLSLCPSRANSTTQQDHGQHTSCCTACSCSADCRSEGSCCPASQPSNQSSQGTHDPIAEHTECLRSHLPPIKRSWTKQFRSYFMVSSCPDTFSDFDIWLKCHQRNFSNMDYATPVYSSRTGRIYANKYCSLCHGEAAEHQRTWAIKLTCRSHIYFESARHMNLSFINSERLTIKQFSQRILARVLSGSIRQCVIAFGPPSGHNLSHLQCISPEKLYRKGKRRICSVDLHSINFSPFLERCSSYYVEHDNGTAGKTHESIHRTLACSLCNGRIDNINGGCALSNVHWTGVPFSILLNYEDEDDSPVSNVKKCKESEMYDSFQEVCRPIICPYFSRPPFCHVMVGELQVETVMFFLRLTPAVPSLTLTRTKEITLSVLDGIHRGLLRNDTTPLLRRVQHMYSWYKTTVKNNDSLVDFIYIIVEGEPAAPFFMKEMYEWLNVATRQMSPLEFAGVPFYMEVDNRKYEVKKKYFTVVSILYHGEDLVQGFELQGKHDSLSETLGLHINKFYFCPQVELGYNDFELHVIGNDFYLTVSKEITVSENEYHIVMPDVNNTRNYSVRVCIDDVIGIQSGTITSFTHDPRPKYHVVSLALCSIVSLCLLICFEIKSKSYRNHFGQISLVLASYIIILEISFGLAQQAFRLLDITACPSVGLFNHFFGLNFIVWLGVCAHYTYRESLSIASGSTVRLNYIPLQIAVFSMGSLSGIFVSVSVLVSLIRSDGTHIGYDPDGCFFSSPVTAIFALIVPVGAGIVISSTYLTMALHCFRKSSDSNMATTGKQVVQRVAVLLTMTLICLVIFVLGIACLCLGHSWSRIGLEVLVAGYGVWSLCLWHLVPRFQCRPFVIATNSVGH